MSARAMLALVVSVVLLAVPWVLPSFYVGIFAYAGIYALVAVGLVLLGATPGGTLADKLRAAGVEFA